MFTEVNMPISSHPLWGVAAFPSVSLWLTLRGQSVTPVLGVDGSILVPRPCGVNLEVPRFASNKQFLELCFISGTKWH